MVNRHYEERMREHRQRRHVVARAHQEIERHRLFLEREPYLADYEAAYLEANGRVCHLVYRRGWVYMAEVPTFRVRLKALGPLAQELRDAADHGGVANTTPLD